MAGPNLPALPSSVDANVRRAFDALKAWFNTAGNALSAADLAATGMFTANNGTLTPNVPFIDSTIPPAITGFTATGAFNTIILQWDDPHYGRLSEVEIWRAGVDNLGVAVKVDSVTKNATVHADTPPDSSTAVTYYYWVRIISTANIAGPYNAVSGTAGTTANDPTYLLEVLTGQLTESQLYSDLNSRIDLIDTPGSGINAIISDLADKQLEYIARQYNEQFLGLMREKNISDATVYIDPVTGEISLLATANVTTDIEARISSLEFDMDAEAGKVEILNHTAVFDRVSVTDFNDAIDLLEGEIALKTTAAYVDAAMAGIAGGATPEASNNFTGETPFAIMNLILMGNRVNLETLLNKANIATAQFDIAANANAISAEATARLQLAALVGENAAALIEEQVARADADTAEAAARATLAARLDTADATNAAAITAETNARVTAISAEASARTTLATRLDTADATNAAAIQTETTARTTAVSAVASSVSTLQTTVSGHTTSIQTQQTSIDGLNGKYTVKIDNNGYVTGFGLASTANNGVPTSEFAIVADKFSIAPVATSSSAADGSPFFYLTTPTVINGVTVPAGAYMKAAFIAEATIAKAMIQNEAVDSSKIANLAVVEAKIASESVTQSKIANLAVTSAKIQDAAITTAKIGSAQIDTLRIAGNAVTVSVGVTGTSATIDADGQPVMIMASGDLANVATPYGGWGYSYGVVTLFRDGVQINQHAYYNYGFLTWTTTFSFGFKDTPGAGSHTYSVTATHTLSNCHIFLTGLKR